MSSEFMAGEKNKGFQCDDSHVIPIGEKKLHVRGRLTDCRCEPVPQYIEKTCDGFIWRRVIVHGRLRRGDS